jgi:hypothetical protein
MPWPLGIAWAVSPEPGSYPRRQRNRMAERRPKGHYPLNMWLYLPESWLGDATRLDRAGVPEAEHRPLTKGQIALELLDRVRDEGLPGQLVLAPICRHDCPYCRGLSEPPPKHLTE